MPPPKILIIGNSIAGPTLATFLLLTPLSSPQKPSITLLDRAPSLRMEGQNIDIRGAGLSIIRHLGLETAIRTSTTGEEGVQIVDAKNRVWGAFQADKTGKVQTPTSDIEILRGRLAELLVGRCRGVSETVKGEGGAGVEFLYGDHVEEMEQEGEWVRVRFAKSGEVRKFDLVVGADGLQSATRKMMWGAEGEAERVKRLGMYGAFFSMPKGVSDTMWRRWYHAYGRRGVMVRPDKQRRGMTVFMHVISEDERFVRVAEKGPREGIEAQKRVMEECFCDAGWESERILGEMWRTGDFYYDMIAQVKMNGWSKGRVVLLGDAAYCASPLSGMGTTLAMMGAYNLAGALTRHPEDLAAAFAEYEMKMRPTVDKAQKLAPGMPRLINPETVWGVWVLNLFVYALSWSGLFWLLARFAGPPAAVPVEDFGFRRLDELEE